MKDFNALFIVQFGFCAMLAAVCFSQVDININHTFQEKNHISGYWGNVNHPLRIEHATKPYTTLEIKNK
jgi:hypothetical protein